MSSSWNCEQELRNLAQELHRQAYDLENAAEILATLRNSDDIKERIASARRRAKEWMK